MAFIKEPFYKTLYFSGGAPSPVSLKPSTVTNAYRVVTTDGHCVAVGNDPVELVDWVTDCPYLVWKGITQ